MLEMVAIEVPSSARKDTSDAVILRVLPSRAMLGVCWASVGAGIGRKTISACVLCCAMSQWMAKPKEEVPTQQGLRHA